MLKVSHQQVTPNNTIFVDGVPIAAKWTEIRRGTSFFIPCINAESVIKQVESMFKKRGWKMRKQVRIENSYFGVRIWRVM